MVGPRWKCILLFLYQKYLSLQWHFTHRLLRLLGMLLRSQWHPPAAMLCMPCPFCVPWMPACGLEMRGRQRIWLAEAGVHMLVRVSPYDELRHSRRLSSALTWAGEFDALSGSKSSSAPALTRVDVRIETFRSSGPGANEVAAGDCCSFTLMYFVEADNTRRKLRARLLCTTT